MRTHTVVYGNTDRKFVEKVNEVEERGWAVRQIIVLPATQSPQPFGHSQYSSNIIVVYEQGGPNDGA